MNPITSTTTTIASKILHNLLKELGYVNIKDFQAQNNLSVDGVFGLKSYTKLYNILLKVEDVNFEGGYWKEQYEKKQIIWHHSAGRDNAKGMFVSWLNDTVKHVGTSIGIEDDGKIYRGFDESFWASSIGCKSDVFANNGIPYIYRNSKIANNRILDECAVCVEVCNSGFLTEKNGKLYTWYNQEMPQEKAIELNYRGYKYFEVYTDAEIHSLKYWTLLNAVRFDIPLHYSHADMWEVSKKALSGEKGLFTHNSYRFDKCDVSPQPKLIEMAKSLESYMI